MVRLNRRTRSASRESLGLQLPLEYLKLLLRLARLSESLQHSRKLVVDLWILRSESEGLFKLQSGAALVLEPGQNHAERRSHIGVFRIQRYIFLKMFARRIILSGSPLPVAIQIEQLGIMRGRAQ